MKNLYKYLIIISIILTIISPIILSQYSSFISFNDASGVIGDTIGGITSPIVNLLAAILVYISFQEQVKANKEQNENQYIERFNIEYEEIKNEYSKIGFNKKELHISLKNRVFESAIDMYTQDLDERKEGNIVFEYQFKYILYLIKYFIEEVEESNIKEKSRKLFVKKIYQFYHSKIEYHIDESISSAENNNYSSTFIILATEVCELIKNLRIKYNIKDSGTY